MTATNFIKEFLFVFKKRLIKFFLKISRIFKRLFLNHQIITPDNCFEIPIIINNRNRYIFLKNMIEQLQSFGYKNIYVLDNDSSYLPLLEYYKSASVKVIFLGKNIGYRALWETEVFNKFKNSYYVYSDPDILLNNQCPNNFVYILYKELIKHSWKEKAGVALKIDDLPDFYEHKQFAINNEKIYWNKLLSQDVFDAPVDTTLALYKPFAFGNAEECDAIRVAGNLSAHHLTWYLDSSNLPEEELFYKNSIKSSTSVYSVK